MLDRPSLTDRVLQLAGDVLAEQPRSRPIGPDDGLREAGLTSMAVVRLMMATEIAFNIEIPNEDLHPDNFRTVRAVARLVERLVGAQGALPSAG
jgi:acyl carrier protein